MNLKPVTLKAILVSAAVSSAVFAVSTLSFAVSGAVLFIASPFISDESETEIMSWAAESATALSLAGLVTCACAVMHSQIDKESEPLKVEQIEWNELISDSISQSAAETEAKTPQVCCDCYYLIVTSLPDRSYCARLAASQRRMIIALIVSRRFRWNRSTTAP